MGRPRQFQESAVVDDAVQQFWEHGYRGTSITDLMNATGLERGSLYKAFDDKHSLFEAALSVYLRSGRAAMRRILEGEGSPLDRLRDWLNKALEGCAGTGGGPAGCLAVNSMIELAPSDARIRIRLARHWSVVEGSLTQTLAEGQRVGEIRDDLPARELAQLIVRMIAGVAVFMRQGRRGSVGRTLLRLVGASRAGYSTGLVST
jgi:TetR/AcrR family transcriptional repressor of nem operon